ncbi:MAG: ATP-binding protein [Chloroflexota bacterium]|nr:ATP-binding protein [Chloroflexota bacterium]
MYKPAAAGTPGTPEPLRLRPCGTPTAPAPKTAMRNGLHQPAPEAFGIGQLFWRIPEAVIVGNASTGQIVLCNPAAERLFGYAQQEIVGRPIEVLVPPDLRPLHQAGLRGYCHTGHGPLIDGRRPIEVPALHRDGHVLSIELTLSPLEAGGLAASGIDAGEHAQATAARYVLALVRDVTERRQQYEQLARQAALLDLINDAILVREMRSSTILEWNQGAERLYGWSRAEALGQSAHVLLRTEFPVPLAEIERAVESSGAWQGELVQSTRDGRRVVVASRWALERAPGGAALAALESNTDITGRREAESARLHEAELRAAAEAAVRTRDEVLAALSHDLRSPVSAIKGQAQLLRRHLDRETSLDPRRVARGLAFIEAAADRMAGWLEELLDLARLQAGQSLELRRERVDLVALVWQVVAEHQQITEQHRLRVATDLDRLLGEWDARRLQRVLDNLLSNAIKYSPEGGEVQVRLSRRQAESGPQAMLVVEDTGVGIPAADMPHIFERFRRAANVAELIHGTGIGLAGARRIVHQHGGTIQVQSQQGVGTKVTVTLPLRSA